MPIPAEISAHVRRHWPAMLPEGTVPGDAPTIVTAFFDIGRGDWGGPVAQKYRRSNEDYLGHFRRLARVQNDMVIFTQPDLAEAVLAARRDEGQEGRTVIYTVDLFAVPEVAALIAAIEARMTETFRRFVWRPDAPEYNSARYVVVNALKSTFAGTALALGAVRGAGLAWIDFGYCRDEATAPERAPWRVPVGDGIDLFACAAPDRRPVFDIVREGAVTFQGCHILGAAAAWPAFGRRLSEAMDQLLACDLVDDDQTLLLMAQRAAPGAVRVNLVDPAGPWGWFFLFRRPIEALPLTDALPDPRRKAGPTWLREVELAVRRWRGT